MRLTSRARRDDEQMPPVRAVEPPGYELIESRRFIDTDGNVSRIALVVTALSTGSRLIVLRSDGHGDESKTGGTGQARSDRRGPCGVGPDHAQRSRASPALQGEAGSPPSPFAGTG